jgi:2,3-bisphosphoglycerate-dependent phosphoglycerate mutase
LIELVYETHSLSTDNEAGIATGWLPGELSERGRELAAELGVRRRNDGLAAVFASDLGRAVETARIAFANTEIPVFLDWRLRECDYGDLTGAPVDRMKAEIKSRIERSYPDGESYRDVVNRVSSFLEDLRRRWAATRVLMIGHAATLWSLQHLLDGEPLEDVVGAPFVWQEGWDYRIDD